MGFVLCVAVRIIVGWIRMKRIKYKLLWHEQSNHLAVADLTTNLLLITTNISSLDDKGKYARFELKGKE